MKILSVDSPEFKMYGSVIKGLDLSEVLETLEKICPVPEDGTVYVASVPELEALPIFNELKNETFGGMDIELGYCSGTNSKLNCLEYHRSDEINIAVNDAILLLALRGEVEDGKIDSSKVKAFFVPAGTCVEFFSSALHYAPCSAQKGKPFRMGVVLPKYTNTGSPDDYKDPLLRTNNKWLYAHADAPEAKEGAVIGITGPNIDVFAQNTSSVHKDT